MKYDHLRTFGVSLGLQRLAVLFCSSARSKGIWLEGLSFRLSEELLMQSFTMVWGVDHSSCTRCTNSTNLARHDILPLNCGLRCSIDSHRLLSNQENGPEWTQSILLETRGHLSVPIPLNTRSVGVDTIEPHSDDVSPGNIPGRLPPDILLGVQLLTCWHVR